MLKQKNIAIKNLEGSASIVTVKVTDFEGYVNMFGEIIEQNKKRQR